MSAAPHSPWDILILYHNRMHQFWWKNRSGIFTHVKEKLHTAQKVKLLRCCRRFDICGQWWNQLKQILQCCVSTVTRVSHWCDSGSPGGWLVGHLVWQIESFIFCKLTKKKKSISITLAAISKFAVGFFLDVATFLLLPQEGDKTILHPVLKALIVWIVVCQLLSVSKKKKKKTQGYGQIVKQNCILCLFLNTFHWPWLKAVWDQGKIWIHKDLGKENCSAKRKQLHLSGLQAILGSHYFFLSRMVQYTLEERKHWRTWRIRPALIMAAIWIHPGLLTQLGTFLSKKQNLTATQAYLNHSKHRLCWQQFRGLEPGF